MCVLIYEHYNLFAELLNFSYEQIITIAEIGEITLIW